MQGSNIILTIKCGMSIIQIPNVTTIYLEPIVVVLFYVFFSFYAMHDHRHTYVPICNLAEMVHNKWLQQSKTQMSCLYEGT